MGNVISDVLAIFYDREEYLSAATAEISASEPQMNRFNKQKYYRHKIAIFKKIKAKLPKLRNKRFDTFEVIEEMNRYLDKLDKRNIIPGSHNIVTQPSECEVLEYLIEVYEDLELLEKKQILSRFRGG